MPFSIELPPFTYGHPFYQGVLSQVLAYGCCSEDDQCPLAASDWLIANLYEGNLYASSLIV